MRKQHAILTCFKYTHAKDFKEFEEDYIRADLRRLLAYTNNALKCRLSDVYVITDLKPNETIRKQMFEEYRQDIKSYLNAIGYSKTIPLCSSDPFKWAWKICSIASNELGIDTTKVYIQANRQTNKYLTTDNVIEFASCFTNFIQIRGIKQYQNALQTIFNKISPHDYLFMYYSGHGSSRNDNSLVVPTGLSKSELLSSSKLEYLLDTLPNCNVNIVFDCCHGGNMIQLPFIITRKGQSTRPQLMNKFKGKNILFISSAIGDEGCGFYTNGRDIGSLFTHELLQEAKSNHPMTFTNILGRVQKKINTYRTDEKKEKQTIAIQSNKVEAFTKAIFPFTY